MLLDNVAVRPNDRARELAAPRTARNLFEMNWDALTKRPSREAAKPVNWEERARLLKCVNQDGVISAYRGIRISATGKRFMIEHAT